MLQLLRVILSARGAGLLRLRRANKPMRLDCKGGECGLCCVMFGREVILTEHEARDVPPELVELRANKTLAVKSCGSACAALRNKTCTIYNQRPHGCREYPFYNIEGELYFDQGCPGMKFDRDGRPAVKSLSSVQSYFPIHRILQRLLISLLRLW
jgi:Fe-S-cluster containining protein